MLSGVEAAPRRASRGGQKLLERDRGGNNWPIARLGEVKVLVRFYGTGLSSKVFGRPLRFQFSDEALFGFTVFLGTTEEVLNAGGDRLVNLPPDDKLQGAWKLSQPAAWLKVAREKPLVTAPGEVGATSEKYSKFFAEDWGAYQIGVWREHFVEFFLNGRKLKGRYTIQYAPMGGRRVWLIGRPRDQTPYAEANKLDEVVNELKGKGQRYLVWARPGEKPKLVEVGKAEQLSCPKCGEALEPGATRLAKLSDDFHDVFRCPGCKHIFSPSWQ